MALHDESVHDAVKVDEDMDLIDDSLPAIHANRQHYPLTVEYVAISRRLGASGDQC